VAHLQVQIGTCQSGASPGKDLGTSVKEVPFQVKIDTCQRCAAPGTDRHAARWRISR
jgi:hypothetical protein